MDLERVWRGGQDQALLLMKGLRQRGHVAELLTPRGSALAERAGAEDFTVHAIGKRARRISAARLARRLVGEKRFDIVYANEAHALTAAWLAGTHHRAPLIAARRVVFPVSRSRLALARYRAAACIVAVSQAVREELLAAKLDPARIEVVADGVEIPPPLSAAARAQARARWQFAPDEHVLTYVASLTAEKGHRLLLQAFGFLRQRMPRCRLLLAGDGPLRAQLERLAQAAGLERSVIFAGFVADVDAVYSASDVFVFPTLREGAGSSLLKAMAFGLPAVAFAEGGVMEIIENKRNGILVDRRDAQALATAAEEILSEGKLAQSLGEGARATITSRFRADRMVDETLHIFESKIDRKRTPPSAEAGSPA